MSTRDEIIRRFMEEAAEITARENADDDSNLEPKSKIAPPIQARALLDMLEIVKRKNPFAPGDLVQQTKERNRYRWPAIGSLAIVLDVFPAKLTEYTSGGNLLSWEDMTILVNTGDTWVTYGVESWRFEKYEGPVESGAN